MRSEEVFASTVRIHTSEHSETIQARSMGQLSKEVASIEEFCLVLQRELTWIVRNNSAGVDDDALNFGTLPVLAPPGDVIPRRVGFGDVGLSPPEHTLIPGNFRCDRRRRGNSRGGGCVKKAATS